MEASYHSDGFYCEDDHADANRQSGEVGDRWPFGYRRDVNKEVVTSDSQTDGHADVGHHGDGGQVLQVGDVSDE